MRIIENQSLTARGDTISSGSRVRHCTTCEREIKSKNSRKEFCSDRCRLLHWAVKVLIKEYTDGKLNGLRDLIQELCE
jgi:hypothetical protein